MKKTFTLTELDCANCAAKMERRIEKIRGVGTANINFMTRKLTIEAAEGDFERILEEAVRACKRIEPDCEIVS